MRNVVVASLLVMLVLTQTGCPGPFGCGGFEGTNNRVYQRNDTEMLILCDNGGFVATLADRMVEGVYADNYDGTGSALNGEDGALAFDVHQNADYTLSTPQLGGASWTQMNLSPTALDHSDVLCQDLQYRAWWSAQ
ncbi:MAG TPA: hypothetical protein VIV11_36105 [Kofleriaceae bacterium]